MAHRYNAGDHYGQQPAYGNGDIGKPQYNIEQTGLGATPPAMDKPNSSGSFGRTPTAHDPEVQLTEAEVGLLRKLRTLNGAEYEAQYFDTKPTPNKASLIEKIGNPTPLYGPSSQPNVDLSNSGVVPLPASESPTP
jgi:hypothetical protein